MLYNLRLCEHLNVPVEFMIWMYLFDDVNALLFLEVKFLINLLEIFYFV